MRQANAVTEEFLHRFKAGDLVDVRVKRLRWSGPHKLLMYKIDPPRRDAKPAAHMKIELREKKKLERWLIVDEQQVIRKHVPETGESERAR